MISLRALLQSFVLLVTTVVIAHSNAAVIPSPYGITLWQTQEAVHIVGVPDAKPDSAGTLTLTERRLEFDGKEAHTALNLESITAVSIGTERVETGGKSGRIARRLIPFGGGMVLASMTHKSIDLLTIEFKDSHNGYHGAVFMIPASEAIMAQELIVKRLTMQPAVGNLAPCIDGPHGNTIAVDPIEASDVVLPAEYRVLLYEQTVEALRRSNENLGVYRFGNEATGIGCMKSTLRIAVRQFKKGNQAVRASTGPVGLFIGTTSVRFQMTLLDEMGKAILERELKQNQHGDTESLNVAYDLAKTVAKRVNKANKNR